MNFSPNNYTYRTVKKVSNKSDASLPYKTSDQIPGSGYGALATVNYRVAHFNFKAGLILDKYGYKALVKDTLYTHNAVILSIEEKRYQIDYILIGVPLRLEGSIGLFKFIELYAGVGSNSYFGGYFSNVTVGPTMGVVKAFSLNSTVGINLKLSNFSIGIAPVYDHLITPFYDIETREGEADKLFLYSYGLEYHINYTFNKRNRKN